MRRYTMACGWAIMICGIVAAARAQENPNEMPFMRMLENPRLPQELKLTGEQTSALKDVHAGIKDKTSELRRHLEESAMTQARLMTADPLDESALLASVEETGRIRTEIAKLNIQALVMLKRILTPEQIATARELVQRRMEMRRRAEGNLKNRWDGRKRDGAGGGKDPKERPHPDAELR